MAKVMTVSSVGRQWGENKSNSLLRWLCHSKREPMMSPMMLPIMPVIVSVFLAVSSALFGKRKMAHKALLPSAPYFP
jgi:hypothetical protein